MKKDDDVRFVMSVEMMRHKHTAEISIDSARLLPLGSAS